MVGESAESLMGSIELQIDGAIEETVVRDCLRFDI